MEPMSELLDLRKRFGDLVALDGLSLQAEAGRVHGFVGRNGAGKTTTMRIALGLLEPDAGEVRLDGRPITAPLVQPVRNAAGVASWWEPLIGVVLVAVSIVFAVRVAARVYAGGALHFQGTLHIREALRRADQRGAPSD
jgi:ABC-type multidrug transport system ATPase subunit